jgi:hypothetical protein
VRPTSSAISESRAFTSDKGSTVIDQNCSRFWLGGKVIEDAGELGIPVPDEELELAGAFFVLAARTEVTDRMLIFSERVGSSPGSGSLGHGG